MREHLIPSKDEKELITKSEMDEAIAGNFIVAQFTFTTILARDAYFSFPANLPSRGTFILISGIPIFQVYQSTDTAVYHSDAWVNVAITNITGFNSTQTDDTGTVLTRAVLTGDEPYVGLCATEKTEADSIGTATEAGLSTATLEITPNYGYIAVTNPDGTMTGFTIDGSGLAIYNDAADGSRNETVTFPVGAPSNINGNRILTTEDQVPSMYPAFKVSPWVILFGEQVANSQHVNIPTDGYLIINVTPSVGDANDFNSVAVVIDGAVILEKVANFQMDNQVFAQIPVTQGSDLSIYNNNPNYSTLVNAAIYPILDTIADDTVPTYNVQLYTPNNESINPTDVWQTDANRSFTEAITELQKAAVTTDVQTFPYSDGNWSGTLNAFEVVINANCSIVSFWGSFTELAVVPTGQSTTILSPASYPLLQRFVGQVDQWARGYNNNTGNFADMPIRITSSAGLEIVAAPNVAIGTTFSFQFMLVLAQ
jgi:hypothetical protein